MYFKPCYFKQASLFKKLALTIFFIIIPLTAHSLEFKNKLALGAGYQYVALKYPLDRRICIEGRYMSDSGVQITGVRLYFSLGGNKKITLFTGIEADTISFSDGEITGAGSAGMLFLGVEIPIHKRITIILDSGPTYTRINDSEYSDIGVEGIDWSINSGINFYF